MQQGYLQLVYLQQASWRQLAHCRNVLLPSTTTFRQTLRPNTFFNRKSPARGGNACCEYPSCLLHRPRCDSPFYFGIIYMRHDATLLSFGITNLYHNRMSKYPQKNRSAGCWLPADRHVMMCWLLADMLERCPHVCCVEITFVLLLATCVVYTTTNSL